MNEFNRKINFKSLVYLCVVSLLLFSGFFVDYLKGRKTNLELILIIFLYIVPSIVGIFLYRAKPYWKGFRVLISVIFLVGYTYTMFAFSRLVIFVMALVLLPILTVSSKTKTIVYFIIPLIFINIIRVYLQYTGIIGSSFDPIEHFIQLCAIAVILACYISSNKLSIFYNNIHIEKINQEKDNQQAAMSKTLSLMDTIKNSTTEFGGHVTELTSYSKEVDSLTNTSRDSAISGAEIVETISNNTDELNMGTKDVGNSIIELKERVSEINNITGMISNISRQINILSLNAAVESARSGEAGQGFAVVASEIKTLADQTAQSTGKINEIIERLNEDVENATSSMTKLESLNATQFKLIDDVSVSYKGIKNSMETIAHKISRMDGMINSVSDSNRVLIDNLDE